MQNPELRKEIIKTARKLSVLGLTTSTWGNVSGRIDEDKFFITPSGIDYDTLQPEDIVEVNSDLSFEGRRKPSTELKLHAEIYRNKKEVKAVVHTHSTFACAFAIAGKSLPPVLEELAQVVGGSVDCTAYTKAGTWELAEKAVKTLGNKKAVFLANHGTVCVGRSLKEAFKVCVVVERAAEATIFGSILGKINVISEDDVAELRKFYTEEYEGGKP
ncbi:MAG TPA: class II aldolase/adducin family protein [Euryarchaeota archaeon]|nr:L-fuculose phosphate aldolase [archaeon BMS3Bbin15]HDL14653.1 class II aldolase/adducin family protein [Euryarchaeota archaeon]